MDQNKRPSIYLQERSENLGRVLDFFLMPHRGSSPGPKELLVVFLAQFGFWEWELDNLLYAFTTFEERATAWEHENGFGLANALRTKGIWIHTGIVKDLKAKRQSRALYKRQVVAPVASLNRVVRQWNELLELCEQRILIPEEERRAAVANGVQLLEDLLRFRKGEIEE